MNYQAREDSQRRDKKKKHRRSTSEGKKHKRQKQRDGSKEQKKKDKDKKKHHSRSRQHESKKDKDRDDLRDKNKDDYKERDREEKNRRQRNYEEKQKRQRSRDKDRQQKKDKQSQRPREKDRKQRDKSKQKEKDRKRDRSKSKKRDRSRDKKHRYDEKGRGGKDRARQDKYQRWRKQAQFRFDSPPKSDESDMSDDPEKMDKLNKMKAEKQLVTSKADRKLYLGNLPPNITSNQLMQMLNSALKKMQINCDEDGDSIVSAWISPDGVGHYAFVEFRTAQEATAGLALNGASLYGYQLKLGRPKQYIEYHKQLLSQFGSDGNIDTILRKVQAMGGFLQPPRIEERLVYPPSRVLALKHIVTVEELAIDQQYNQIVEDVTEMAKRHGDLIKVVVPRPMQIDLEQVKTRVKGLGYIFIKYKNVQQAKYARKQFIKQMFSDRSVACSFFPEKKLEEGELDVIDKIIIDF